MITFEGYTMFFKCYLWCSLGYGSFDPWPYFSTPKKWHHWLVWSICWSVFFLERNMSPVKKNSMGCIPERLRHCKSLSSAIFWGSDTDFGGLSESLAVPKSYIWGVWLVGTEEAKQKHPLESSTNICFKGSQNPDLLRKHPKPPPSFSWNCQNSC